MNEHDTMVVRALKDSYRLQTGYYTQMNEMVHALLSRLILGRGDMAGVKETFLRKQAMLASIEAERVKMSPHISFWQKRKSHITGDPETRALETVLLATERAITAFLESEEQLKKHIERMIRKGV